MKECGLTQKALARAMGVGLDRVKSITSGKVQKLTREEGEALIRKLHIRGDWLATGEGPMFQSEGERRFMRLAKAIGSSSKTAAKLGLSESERILMMELLYYVETDDGAGLSKALRRLTELSLREAALLDSFRNASADAQDALVKTGAAMAKQKIVKKTGAE